MARRVAIGAAAALFLLGAGAAEAKLPPANTIEGGLARSPILHAHGGRGVSGDQHIEKRLAAVFLARGIRNFTPAKIRDVALAQIKTGTPAGVLASISEREFSHNTVRVPGSIPGTVSSSGYFSPFAFKKASWEYYRYELWGDSAESHSPFDYGDAAMVAGTILQHYRGAGDSRANHVRVDPLGALKDYNANYAASALKDAQGKYASPLWARLIKNLAGRQAGGAAVIPGATGVSAEELLWRGLKMRFELFFSGIPQATR